MNSDLVAINLSEKEYEKSKEALQYGALTITTLYRVLIKAGLDEMNESPELIFRFDREKIIDKTTYKTKTVRLDRQQYKAMEDICLRTPFSMSALAKYFIMPKVDEIVENKKWNINV